MSGARDDGPVRAVTAGVLTGARRILTVPLTACLVPVAAVLLLVVTVLSAPVSALRHGRWRLVRICGFALFYLVVDLFGLMAAALVWLRYAPGTRDAARRRTATTFALLDRLLRVLTRAAGPVFGLRVRVTPAVPRVAGTGAPVVVLVRHAGPGDSFLLLHVLLDRAGLRPHTVLKRMLRFDPCLDVIIGRLPHCFLPARRGRTAADAVGKLASGLRSGDALVLFPEGGNYTERRHRRAVASLRRHGKVRTAARAARMRHVLPPHAGGALAALAAAPGADVVFVAHTGLDAIDSLPTLWEGIPLREPVRAHWWRVPAAEVPEGDAAREEWLLAQWAKVDRWIADH
ncbi:1-acyl-sn-glycerol-3-phosphate acyltransferase [Streptomyces sp. RPT161]|uniref:1-acyl-sn-glycerol-3-phosphate acyltransferase n=1 Tax=Streptomyces sp. RPT161 TaxID=3015993 RepID=UPI0022B8B9AB|nr:1-acyl-sn-glycerol-3-phosphate acyltransferase [Streptomyces sp. RPT161]